MSKFLVYLFDSKVRAAVFTIGLSLTLFFGFTFLFYGCAGLSLKYPDTPTGRGLLYGTTYFKQVAGYKFKITLPNLLEDEKKILGNQRHAIIEAHRPLLTYVEWVASGKVPTLEMDQLITRWLEQIAHWAIGEIGAQTADKVHTDEEIKRMLERAGAIESSPMFQSKSIDPSLVLILIELAKGVKDFLLSLMDQASMSPEEIAAAFARLHQELKDFNPATLPEVPR